MTKIGLFISRCDGVVSETIDLYKLKDEFSESCEVVKVVDNFYKPEDLKEILKEVEVKELDAVIFAGNSKHYFNKVEKGKYIIGLLEKKGINVNKIKFANLKEWIALPHKDDRKGATEKAKSLIKVMLERIKFEELIEMIRVTPRKEIAIIGANIAGILAAKRFLTQGYRVHIIDDKPQFSELGKYKDKLLPTQTFVNLNSKADCFLNTEIEDVYGFAGNYHLRLNTNGNFENINVGGIVIADGANKKLTDKVHPLLHIDIDDAGLFKTLNNDTLCVETKDPGITVIRESINAGTCSHVEKNSVCTTELREISNLVNSAVLHLTAFLSQNEIIHESLISEVDENVCGGCGTCVKTCMFHASKIDPVRKISMTDPLRCKGCGNCVTACPTGAKDLLSNSNAL